MKTNPFCVGDRVLITGIQSSLSQAVGREGTVVFVLNCDYVIVQFDERFSSRLHDGNDFDYTDSERRCWQYEINKIELVPFDLPSLEDIRTLL